MDVPFSFPLSFFATYYFSLMNALVKIDQGIHKEKMKKKLYTWVFAFKKYDKFQMKHFIGSTLSSIKFLFLKSDILAR